MSKVSVIGIVGVPACYGGFESLVENLLPSSFIDLVYCSRRSYISRPSKYKGANLKYLPINANGFQSVLYDSLSILHSLFFTRNDLLILGVSGALVLPIVKLFDKRKIVTNIDGLEWKRDKWGGLARWFLKFSEGIAVKYSDVVVADNEAIANYVEGEYGVQSEVIAYGGDHVICSSLPSVKGSYGLGLCRIEPENNVEMILHAFSKYPDKELKFVGNWGNSNYGVALKEKYSVHPNIQLIDPVYDLQSLFELRSRAKYYFHGHSAGGTNPSLVEMMFFDIPIYCYDCDYNRATTENSATYFKDSRELEEKLGHGASDLSFVKMSEIANRRYTWTIIKARYGALF